MSSDHLIVLQLLYHWVVVRVIRLLHWGRIKRSAKSFRCVVTHYLYVVKNHCFVLLITFCINTKDSFILYWSQKTFYVGSFTYIFLHSYYICFAIYIHEYNWSSAIEGVVLVASVYLYIVIQKRVNDLWEVRNYTTAFFVFTHSVH